MTYEVFGVYFARKRKEKKKKRKTLSKDMENFMKVQNGNINSNGVERREKSQWCERIQF
jgi:hypothetical protein